MPAFTGAAAPRLALAAALAALAALPAGYLLASALPVLGEGGWLAHLASTTLPRQAANSLRIAIEASLVAFAVGALPAIVVARFDFPGRGLVSVLALLPLLFAPWVTASTWTVAFSADFFSSRLALSIQHGLATAPYLFVVFRIAASRVPRAFGEAAAALGHDAGSRLLRVHLPLYAVPIAAGLMIVFAQSVGDYAASSLLGVQTLSLGLGNLWLASQRWDVAAIGSTLLIVPALLLVAAAAWASTSLMSRNPVPPAAAAVSRRPLSRPAAAALLAWSIGWSLPGFVVPELLTLRWAWSRWDPSRMASLPADVGHSIATATASAATVTLLCLLIAVVLRAGGATRHAERLPWLFLVNWFLPSMVLALAFVAMTRDGSLAAQWLGPLRDTRALVVVAEALRFMPLALLPMLDALRRTPPAMIEAARAHGAGPLRARAVAYAGHVAPALALGAALVFMESVKALDLSLMLQPFGYSSLALKPYGLGRFQVMDRAAPWVLASQLLMLAPLVLLAWRMRRLDPSVSSTPRRGSADRRG